jgi:methyl-accepting chemotaxis protein
VAAEVRKLAERSKAAADEINGLSNYSVTITEDATNLLNNIIPQIEKTTMLIQEISSASVEQNSGAEQVNRAMQQLSNVSQQNAAASEEMSASAEQMTGQAAHLEELITYFKIDAEQANDRDGRKMQHKQPDIGSGSVQKRISRPFQAKTLPELDSEFERI